MSLTFWLNISVLRKKAQVLCQDAVKIKDYNAGTPATLNRKRINFID